MSDEEVLEGGMECRMARDGAWTAYAISSLTRTWLEVEEGRGGGGITEGD
jgi:hypothetical protein